MLDKYVLIQQVAEFAVVSNELTTKYGKEFTEACVANSLESVRVNEKLIHRMSIAAPPPSLVGESKNVEAVSAL